MKAFKKLHEQNQPLLICNIWDVPSAKTAEKLSFQAIATSSSALAAVLGYKDGEDMEFSELVYMVKRIASSINLPLSVDLEGGYSRDPKKIAHNVKTLADMGVVGINIEDTVVEKERRFLAADDFAKTLAAVKNQLEKDQVEVFFNVRTDPFLMGHPKALEESLKRIKYYQDAGADGIFVPFLKKEGDIRRIVASTPLPVNVLSMPDLPDFKTLGSLGVKRISMGGSLFAQLNRSYEKALSEVLENHSFTTVFE